MSITFLESCPLISTPAKTCIVSTKCLAVGGAAINEFTIHHFTGEDNTDYSVNHFITSVDQLSTSLKLNNEQTSTVAIASTTGKGRIPEFTSFISRAVSKV